MGMSALWQRAKAAADEVEAERSKLESRRADLQGRLAELRGQAPSREDAIAAVQRSAAAATAELDERIVVALFGQPEKGQLDFEPRCAIGEDFELSRFAAGMRHARAGWSPEQEGLRIAAALAAPALAEAMIRQLRAAPDAAFGLPMREKARRIEQAERELAEVEKAQAALRGEDVAE